MKENAETLLKQLREAVTQDEQSAKKRNADKHLNVLIRFWKEL